MSHETPRDAPPTAGESLTAMLVDIGGGYGEYASPHAVVAAAFELMQKVIRRLASLSKLPSGAQGGFLQPPQGSHFSREG